MRGNDETAELLGALREMNHQLVRVITEVRASTETVAHEAVVMAGGTEDLARRTEVQASNLQETAASITSSGAACASASSAACAGSAQTVTGFPNRFR